MKNILRFFFGLASSLLLVAGFMRVAEKFDPVSAEARKVQDETAKNLLLPCSLTCAEPERLIRERV